MEKKCFLYGVILKGGQLVLQKLMLEQNQTKSFTQEEHLHMLSHAAGVVTETIPKTAIALSTLKTKYTEIAKQTGHTMIKRYSWLAERKTFAGTAVPSAVTSHVAAVVSASATICTAIDDCDNLDDFMALWTVPESGNAPIDDWPTANDAVAAYKRI